MVRGAPDGTEDGRGPSDDRNEAETDRGPTIVHVDENEKRARWVANRLQDDVSFRAFGDPEDALEVIDRSLAVLVVSGAFDDTAIETLVYTALARAPFCHVALLSRDREPIAGLDVRADAELTSPLTRAEFGDVIDSLYLRATYLAGLQRYFRLSLALNDRRIRLKGKNTRADETFLNMEAELERLEGRLDALSEQFSAEDYRELMSRLQRQGKHSMGVGTPVTNPQIFGLPETCPDCGLEWGVWHGPTLGHGFERIAANVWRCTECDRVIDNPDPSHKRVARR